MPLPRRRVMRGLVAMPALLLATRRPAAAQGALWTMATADPANSVSGTCIAFFAGRLAAESGRRLVVLPSYDAAFGLKAADIPRAVGAGKLAAGCASAGALGGLDPLFLLSALPFATRDDDDARGLLERARGLYARRLARAGQRLLYAAPGLAAGLWARRPIRNPSDIVALKLGVDDPAGREVFDAAHADVSNLAFTGGRREAVLAPGDEEAATRLRQSLPFFTDIGYAVPLSFATLATPLYERLPADLRDAVDRAASATQDNAWQVLVRRRGGAEARLRAGGITVTTAAEVSPELHAILARAAARTIDKWKTEAGPEAAALLR